MRTTFFTAVAVCFFSIISSAQNSVSLKIGTSNIKLESIEYKTDTLLFVNLHSDEITSIQAVEKVLPEHFGKFSALRSGGTREVKISENGVKLTFDPNRIFTRTGIEKTLRNYACYSKSNFEAVESFSKQFLQNVTSAKLLVAVHNNGNSDYSVNSILRENKIKKDALQIFVNPEKDEDDFYYVTEKSKFDYLKSKGYNVVLQDNINVEDDGSLSVYCGKNYIDYINIECEKNHLNEQIQMVEEIYKGILCHWTNEKKILGN
jgi:hypothetical protein